MFGLTGTLTASGHRSVKWNVWFSVLPRRSRSSVVRKRLFAREAACDHEESKRKVRVCKDDGAHDERGANRSQEVGTHCALTRQDLAVISTTDVEVREADCRAFMRRTEGNERGAARERSGEGWMEWVE
jgi:hypothetical protein